MYCPTCGKQTPDNSTFCLHCGSKITASSDKEAQVVTEWEYKDFVIDYTQFKPRPGHAINQRDCPTLTDAAAYIWNYEQTRIREQMQSWLDEGWEPIEPIGPKCFQLRERSAYGENVTPVGWIIIVFLCFFGIGFAILLTLFETIGEATEFRVQMRRTKRSTS